MSDPLPIRFSVPEAEFDLALPPEAARKRGSHPFRAAVTTPQRFPSGPAVFLRGVHDDLPGAAQRR
jgi:hypothetical protein